MLQRWACHAKHFEQDPGPSRAVKATEQFGGEGCGASEASGTLGADPELLNKLSCECYHRTARACRHDEHPGTPEADCEQALRGPFCAITRAAAV